LETLASIFPGSTLLAICALCVEIGEAYPLNQIHIFYGGRLAHYGVERFYLAPNYPHVQLIEPFYKVHKKCSDPRIRITDLVREDAALNAKRVEEKKYFIMSYGIGLLTYLYL
jgi:hypothetical protein